MKYRYLCLYLILASTFALTSCKDKKKDVKTLEQDYVQQPQMILNSNDSNEVRDAVNYYLTALNHKQVDKALSMLFYYDLKTNKVRRLTDKENAEQKAVLDSEVKYNIYFSDKPSTPSNPNCMGFMIRPVRLEGRWYLTLAGENQATYSSQIDKQQ